MLSSKTKYALRAILRLAENAPEGIWLQTNDVAEREQVPRKFLEAIFVQLRDHGIIESRRGAQGGHRMLRDPATVSVADVIRVLDGPLALTPCASRTRFRQCADCVDISECRLQPLMQRARDAVAGVLENCSLAELASAPRSSTSRPAAGKVAAGGSAGSPKSQTRLPSSSWAKRKASVARIA
jgi:Rrf2 family protein